MEDIPTGVDEQRRIGLELHQAEWAIGVGRRAMRELVLTEPIDTVALESRRAEVSEARLRRNSLRDELQVVKDKSIVFNDYRWTPM